MLGAAVYELDLLDLKEGPQPIGHLQDLLAGAYRAGSRHSLDALTAHLNHPLNCALKVLGSQPAALMQLIPVDWPVTVAMQVAKQLVLKGQQLCSDFTASAPTFCDGPQIEDQVRPAQLALVQGKICRPRTGTKAT